MSKLRASNQDEAKFYITFAKDTVQLRAESSADRALWLKALEEHAAFNAALAQVRSSAYVLMPSCVAFIHVF